MKVETLTKPDIDEIERTGKLGWYEEKQKAKEETVIELTVVEEPSSTTEE